MLISVEMLRRLIDYNPETGAMVWRPRGPELFGQSGARAAAWNKRFAGRPALSSQNKLGYRTGHLLGTPCKAHRAAWAIQHGEWPNHIDHINGNPSDNRITNLRSVTHQENHRNRPLQANNTSGCPGVTKNSHGWTARIKVSGSYIYLGSYRERQDAIAARKAAEREYGFHRNSGRKQA